MASIPITLFPFGSNSLVCFVCQVTTKGKKKTWFESDAF
jgi:hypothetical protein